MRPYYLAVDDTDSFGHPHPAEGSQFPGWKIIADIVARNDRSANNKAEKWAKGEPYQDDWYLLDERGINVNAW